MSRTMHGPVAPETPRSLPPRGQGLVEYALIIALVAVLLFAALSAMHDHLSTVFSQVGGGL